jgi:hypothetical protein
VTSIVLVIVGIMLAAAAALMVAYYGGDAYNSANAKAAAATIVNLGENVRNAAELYRMQEGSDPPDPAALVSAGYLGSPPDIGTLGTPQQAWRDVDAGTGPVRAYVITDVDARICDEIGARGSRIVGCVEDGSRHLFYARIS